MSNQRGLNCPAVEDSFQLLINTQCTPGTGHSNSIVNHAWWINYNKL